MHAPRAGAGGAAPRPKLLYLFRSPSHVQVGRTVLDAEVREALEHTHPDLTFDWNGLLRENPVPTRQPRVDPHDPRERGGRGKAGRSAKGGRSERGGGRPPDVQLDDSVLGRALGTKEAARLRHRFAELGQRIERRARTPEERARLVAELSGVDPALWHSIDEVRQRARSADAAWDAIAAQLPKRRRGRRGGAEDAPDQNAAGDVIIGERDDTDARETPTDDADVVAADGPGDLEPERPAAAESPAAEPAAPDVHEPG